MITTTATILLSLLNKNMSSPLTHRQWKEVYHLAAEQGVMAMAFDSLADLPKEMLPPRDILLSWGLTVDKVEKRYHRQSKVAQGLSDQLEQEMVSAIVMKGFSIGRYYPNPEHRECGDIDIYGGIDKYKNINEIIIKLGGSVEEDYYRHAHCLLNGVTIENHMVISDVHVKQDDLLLENTLKEEADRILKQGAYGLVYPSAGFNALFLSWHAASHFMFEKIQLRHIYDWKVFLENEAAEVDENWYLNVKAKVSFGKFADILTSMAVRLYGVKVDSLPEVFKKGLEQMDDGLVDRVITYIFESERNVKSKSVWKHRVNLAKRAFKDRWKFREIYGMSMWRMLWMRACWVVQNKRG